MNVETVDDLAALRAEIASLRERNAELEAQIDGDTPSGLLAQAQVISDHLIEDAMERVQRILRAARKTPPYANIDKILRLGRRAHRDLQDSADRLQSAADSLGALLAEIEQPQVFVEPKPDPLNDRRWHPPAS